jgi:hypothetical protein
MSNYTIAVNWSGKDALSDSDAAKVISGSEFNTEFTAVQAAVNTKANINGNSSEAFACNALAATSGTVTTLTSTTANITTVDLGNWTVTETAGVLLFATGGTNKMKLDASGNLTCVGNVTGFGTI